MNREYICVQDFNSVHIKKCKGLLSAHLGLMILYSVLVMQTFTNILVSIISTVAM